MGEATGATAQQGRVGVGEEAGELEDAVEAARVGGGGGKTGQHGLAPDIDDTVSERDPVGGRVRAALRVGLADGRSCGRCLLHATACGRHALGVSGGTKTSRYCGSAAMPSTGPRAPQNSPHTTRTRVPSSSVTSEISADLMS